METREDTRRRPPSCELSENQCGMETCTPWSVRVTRSELSENQCGMETMHVYTHKQTLACVEREPMWDGNVIIQYYYIWLVCQLSENQCGMETTHRSRGRRDRTSLSENQCGMETRRFRLSLRQLLVEREPMWDGNMCLSVVITNTNIRWARTNVGWKRF